MRVRISSEVLAAIRAHAASDPHREVCGLLFGTSDRITGSQPTRNVSPHPARNFEIDPATLIAAFRAERAGGLSIAGYYHSHPFGSARPSATDQAMAAPDGKLWLIVAGADVRAFRASEGGLHPMMLVTAR